ncbi:MAG: protein phosphatase, partial [Selenomonadaceae bacterium]|nr:protein phosphatase [Selenomonadaceae bacterium]
MRKSNSIFRTAFVSEAGSELANNDYFAYVEFDDYACYALASGITDFETSNAAKEVVEHLILSFEEKASMSKSTLLQYMKETNERLLSGNHARRLKASVIMVVTDYEKFRYVAAGNVRLRMYRQGRFLMNSSDMSLASDLIAKGDETPLDRHEERHNLYAYLGKKDFFRPFVSKVQKLQDSDIILLYSQGLWEHVDSQEIDEIIEGATDDPQVSVDTLEDVLLSRQPKNLKSYTAAAIFVNKVYRDPDRERKRLFYIKVAIGVVVVLLIGAIIFYIFHSIHRSKLEKLEKNKFHMTEYVKAENYVRAQESCKAALILAEDLHRKDDENELRDNLTLFDDIIKANDFIKTGDYYSAYDTYMNVLKDSAGVDKTTRSYIQRRINKMDSFINVVEFLKLGDSFFQQGNYDEAEGMYLKAIEMSNAVHDNTSREKAFAAIEKIYDKRASLRKEAADKADEKKQVAMSDAMKKGDDLLAAGDLDGARKAYLDAR